MVVIAIAPFLGEPVVTHFRKGLNFNLNLESKKFISWNQPRLNLSEYFARNSCTRTLQGYRSEEVQILYMFNLKFITTTRTVSQVHLSKTLMQSCVVLQA